MLEKHTSVDKIEIAENGIVLVRTVTRILENGIELSKSYHRTSINPGADFSHEDARVIAVCEAIHTPAVIAAFLQEQND